jgi:hypothetical protein
MLKWEVTAGCRAGDWQYFRRLDGDGNMFQQRASTSSSILCDLLAAVVNDSCGTEEERQSTFEEDLWEQYLGVHEVVLRPLSAIS